MIRRILAAVMVVLGLVAIGLGVASSTIWRSADTVTAAMPSAPSQPVVVVQPGVLGLVAETVTVIATAPTADSPVVLAFAPAGDVTAWVGDGAHVQVTGMTSWEELRTAEIEGEATVPNPAGADLWTSEVLGAGEVVVDLTADDGDVALLVAADGTQTAPTLTLRWTVPVTTPFLVPLLAVGGVLLVLGLGLLAYDILVRREVRARESAREERRTANETATSTMAVVPQEVPTPTDVVGPALTDTALTRRQLRELERLRRQEDPRLAADGPVAGSGGASGAGIVPAVVDPERHRALRYVDAEAVEESPAAPASVPAPAPEDAGPARGSAIVPGVADPHRHRQPSEEPERTSWRDLWGFGEEEQR